MIVSPQPLLLANILACLIIHDADLGETDGGGREVIASEGSAEEGSAQFWKAKHDELLAVIKSADGGRNEKDEETDIEELDTDTLSTASVHNREFVSVEKKNVFYKKLIKSRLSQEANLHEAYNVKFDQSQMLKEIIDGQHSIFHRSVLERKAQRSDPYESVEDQLLVRKTRRDWERLASSPCHRPHKLSIEVRAPSHSKSHQGSSL